jgi:hypothetical protein
MEMLWKKYDSSRFIKNIKEFMPLFLQIYEEKDKNIKEKKYLKLISPEKCSCSYSASN